MSKTAKRADILNQARDLIGGDRAETYGDATASYRRIGKIWGAMLGIEPIKPEVALSMMVALKLVRGIDQPSHDDSWIDAAGYIGLAGEAAVSETSMTFVAEQPPGFAETRDVPTSQLTEAELMSGFTEAYESHGRIARYTSGSARDSVELSYDTFKSKLGGEPRWLVRYSIGCSPMREAFQTLPEARVRLEEVRRSLS